MDKKYIAIDLKSFYASVECMERGLDPLSTNLVVADPDRTNKTICLAVTPSLKAYGLSGRSRLFEVVKTVKEANLIRLGKTPNRTFTGKSYDDNELKRDKSLEIDYVIAPPQMAKYVKKSTDIYSIYLDFFAPEDMHVYSIDEVFIDATGYLQTYGLSATELARVVIHSVSNATGITSVAGVGSNLYLAKIAMDIMAKKAKPDENGFRVAFLDEMSYKKQLWEHTPLTDFWRIGSGYKKKLERCGLFTMGDIARCSLGGNDDYYNEELLYSLFGVNAELLIDHAWGYEPCGIADVKSYKSETNSISSGQVLKVPYDYEGTRLVVHEMAELLVLDMVEKGLATNRIVLTVGYDIQNIEDGYDGEIKIDNYGRKIPKHAHGTCSLGYYTSSAKTIIAETLSLYDRIINPKLWTRRITLVAGDVLPEDKVVNAEEYEQIDLFSVQEKKQDEKELQREKSRQLAVLEIQKKYGKNAIVKGMSLQEEGTARERNSTIGGHKA